MLSFPDTPPVGPYDPTQYTPASAGDTKQIETDSNISSAVRAWETMFQGNATADQVKQMIQNVLRDVVQNIKSEGEKALQAIKQMKEDLEESQE